MGRRHQTPLRITVALLATTAASCGSPDAPRWARPADAVADSAPMTTPTERVETAIVDTGPIVDVRTVTATVGFAEVQTIVSDRVGRIERRLLRVGETAVPGAPIFELSAARDPADDLRIEILEAQRDLAELEGRVDDIERLDEEITAERSRELPGGAGVVEIDDGGVLNRYLADVFSTVRVGTPLYELGAGSELVATFDAPAAALDIGDEVRIRRRDPLAEPMVGAVESRMDRVVTVTIPSGMEVAVGDELDVDLDVSTEADGLRVPTSAVRTGPDGVFLVTVSADGTWSPRLVGIGESTDDFTRLLDGPAPGTVVIVP